MIAFLTKSDASEGFDQIVDFLNAHMIQYALMVNPTIYVSCIKQFWTSVSIKKSNDIVRLQALIDRKKVIITDDTIRQSLRLDDVDVVICLATDRKFNFSKYIFDSMVRNVDSPSKFLMYPRFLQLIINVQVDDLSSHNTKYTSPALTQKLFANMRRIGKGFLGVDTPLFDGMLVQQVQAVEDAAEDGDDDNKVSVEPTPPSPTPATPPPSPTQEHIPSPPQAQTAQPSPPPPQQPSQTVDISQSAMTLLNTLLETCATLTKQVANLEQDKIAQAIKITKLKQRAGMLKKKRQFKSLRLKRLRKVGTAQKDVTLVDAEEDMNAHVQGRLAESKQRRRRGVVIQDPEETTTASVIVHTEVKSKDKGNGILIEEPKPLKRQAQIEQDEAFARQLEAELNANINWDDHDEYLKNMAGLKMHFFKGMTYNEIRPIFEKHYNLNQAFLERVEEEVIGQKEEESKRKGDSLNQDAAKKQRINEEEEELKAHLQIVVHDDDDVFTEATPLASKVPVVDYQIHHENNKPYYKIIRADGTHKLFLSFITLLKNFDREDLEMLWKLVQESFKSLEPKNFSDDFLLNTFKIMFEKPNVEANI
uniref:Xylulose kinase-1 n=1 Tax=Tanacetum cinerariifolium TaxID=118510 RepID=A0A6L2NZC0_TANCI|nr:hypothetical protein [Tanacetum cinerariifolium]